MAGGGAFIGRVIDFVANKFIVDGLANSPAFQRFAVRTSKQFDNVSNIAAQKTVEVAKQLEELSKELSKKLEQNSKNQ